jgi:hypothetical protein
MISLDMKRILFPSKKGSEENYNQIENNDNSGNKRK